MTLGRVGQLAWVFGRNPTFTLDAQIAQTGQNIAPIDPKIERR